MGTDISLLLSLIMIIYSYGYKIDFAILIRYFKPGGYNSRR